MQPFILIITAIAVYFLPALIGSRTKYAAGIMLLNLLLGWTVLGWIAALIWSVSAPRD